MRIAPFCILLCAAQAALASWSYSAPNLLNPYVSGNWTSNGTISAGTNSVTSSGSGSLIYSGSLGTEYEVRSVLTLAGSGGYYDTYLHATSNALYGPTLQGTSYVVELQNPTFSGSSCSATIALLKVSSGTATLLYNTSAPCHSGMEMRVVYSYGTITAYIDRIVYVLYADTSIATGQAGIGVRSTPAGSSISAVDMTTRYTGAPTAVDRNSLTASSFPNRVDFKWTGAGEPNGPGIAWYQILRGPTGGSQSWLANINNNTTFEDTTVSASTSYTYTLIAYDYHLNSASTTGIVVDTPPTGALDPRQVGVRPLGSYWGGMGEQIDMRSGNLNYSQPIMRVAGRHGGGVGFNLSYNSQNWRNDTPTGPPGVTFQFGRDNGVGYGWRMQAGSLTPVYSDYWTIHHWQFIDASGAEYRLDKPSTDPTNSDLVWTSSEAIYLFYDATKARLYFKDGSFWVFGAVSGGIEQDSGTMYPTLIEDSNGNQVTLSYDMGAGTTWWNSSARIKTISDVRSSYLFTYTTLTAGDPFQHLTSIGNGTVPSENFTFSYSSSPQPLTSPWGGSFGTAYFLQGITATNTGLTTTLAYDTGGSGELTQVTAPYGGHLRWSYGAATLLGNRAQREVQNRYLSSDGSTESQYTISRAFDGAYTFHTYADLADVTGQAEKVWWFNTSAANFYAGLQTDFEERQLPGQVPLHHASATWAQDGSPSGSPYVATTYNTQYWSSGTSWVQSKSTQTVDQYGNVLTQNLYDFGATNVSGGGALLRTYTNTYLSTTAYTSVFIRNRLLTSTVTDGVKTVSLASNTYDAGAIADDPGATLHDSVFGTGYWARGNLTNSVAPGKTTGATYDISGNVSFQTVNGVTTTVTTNSSTNYAAPSSITTGSLTTNLSWNSFLGLTSAQGPNGDTAYINGYDGGARPTSTTSPYGAVTNYKYTDTPYPLHVPTRLAVTGTHATLTTLDGFGRTIKSEAGTVTGTWPSVTFTSVSVVDTKYAPCGCTPVGKPAWVSKPHAPAGTQYWTKNFYDGIGRTTSTQTPDGSSTTTYAYAGANSVITVAVTDPAGKTKTFSMDALGNLKKAQEADPTLGTVYTNYTYDVLNHLISVSMPRGSTTQTRTFNYLDPFLLQPTIFLYSATNPETGTVTYTYNSDSTIASKTDAKNQQIQYSYDSYKRVTQVRRYPVAGGSEDTSQQTNYYYDSNPFDATFSQYTAGRLAAVKYGGVRFPGSFIEMYSYVQPGGVARKRLQATESLAWVQSGGTTYWNSTLNFDAGYQYDGEGRMTQVTYPSTVNGSGLVTSGPTYNYTYDTMGRLNGATDQSSTTIVSGVSYTVASQLQNLTYYGVAETRGYDAATQQLTSLQVGSLMNMQYNYTAGSNNGKIASQKDWISGEQVTYAYDSLNRLQSATAGTTWGESYSYDGFGNLYAKTVTAGTAPTLSIGIDATTNRVTGTGYSHDANGNLTTVFGGTTYSYDIDNRLVYSNAGAQYAYDVGNKRVWQAGTAVDSNGNVITQQVNFYGVDGKKLGSYSVVVQSPTGARPYLSDGPSEVNTYFGGKLVGRNGSAAAKDRLGSQRTPTGGYFPYGEDKGTPLANDQVKFATYTRDSATGLDYADQRYYSSALGRFMSPDPYNANSGGPGDKSDPVSWNRYSYTGGDPINRVDPGGTCWAITSSDAGVSIEYYECPSDPSKSDAPNTITYHGLDPGPLSLTERVALAKAYQAQVQKGMNDCEALADFASDLASHVSDATNEGQVSQFVASFGVLTPNDGATKYLNWTGIVSTANAVFLNLGMASGYEPVFQNTTPDGFGTNPNANGDQGHHFAAFFQFGFRSGSAAAGAAASFALEYAEGPAVLKPMNWGDVYLGDIASQIGADLANRLITPWDVASRISGLCKH